MKKMLPVEIWTIVRTNEGNAVLLRPFDKDLVVPVFVGQNEIQSILIGKDGITLPRPLTHDLLLNLLASQELVLDRVEINELKNDIFHARLIITGGNYSEENPLLLDCRPSDALGLATRRGCPALVSADIIKKTGIPLSLFIDVLKNSDSTESGGKKNISVNKKEFSPKESFLKEYSPIEEKRRNLIKKLNAAVECEEYEEAAKIRDLLKTIEGDLV
ncbi:MAG: bifunctional nuclease family protein [Treponema sp.]|nr:bifunctional nuclease family protein [Treponema sp.]